VAARLYETPTATWFHSMSPWPTFSSMVASRLIRSQLWLKVLIHRLGRRLCIRGQATCLRTLLRSSSKDAKTTRISTSTNFSTKSSFRDARKLRRKDEKSWKILNRNRRYWARSARWTSNTLARRKKRRRNPSSKRLGSWHQSCRLSIRLPTPSSLWSRSGAHRSSAVKLPT